MEIIYNIEDFIIKQMLMPYQNLIVADEKCINDVKKQIRKDPMVFLHALENNKEAHDLVYNRLAKLGPIRFYKWIKHPAVEYIYTKVADFSIVYE